MLTPRSSAGWCAGGSPGWPGASGFDDLFRQPPFMVLEEGEQLLVSGLVGRIWTLRRDYPTLSSPDEFQQWSPGRQLPGGVRQLGRRAATAI